MTFSIEQGRDFMKPEIDNDVSDEPIIFAKPLFAFDDCGWAKEYEAATGEKLPLTCSPWLRQNQFESKQE